MYLLLKLITISILVEIIFSDNIDTEFAIKFSFQKSDTNSRDEENINGSYFGYSLAVNQYIDDQNHPVNLVLIGAPKLDSRLYGGRERTGAIFRCQWSEREQKRDVNCREIDFKQGNRRQIVEPTKGMNLGSSLAKNANIFVGCGHLWVRQTSPIGKCYRISDQGSVVNSFGPNPNDNEYVTQDGPQRGRPWNSHLMYGFSLFATQSEESFFMGAPGYRDYLGSVLNHMESGDQLLDMTTLLSKTDPKLTKTNGYLGYSLTTGFFDNANEYLVMSAPRNKIFSGHVLIYPLYDFFKKRLEFLGERVGESDAFGEYFGASVLTLDTNNDKFDDLVVGAPLYSNQSYTEVGRVYVFLINEKGTDFKKKDLIFGHQSRSRFGSALSTIDLNLDKYQDLVVGAPFEENSDGSRGAVYIYMGSQMGLITERPHMRIGAEVMKSLVLNGFGISFVTNVDFDGNGYNDLLIGSYLSENAVLLRTKPIASLSLTSIIFKPNKIRVKHKNCNDNQDFCFRVEYCVNYQGKNIRDKQPALITLEITDSKLRVREQRVSSNAFNKTVELRANRENCFANDNSFIFNLNDTDKLIDIITPIEIQLTVDLINQRSNTFCKDCAITSANSSFGYIDFEHGCHSKKCVSKLKLSVVSTYGEQEIGKTLIEGLHNPIDVEIGVNNTGEASINTDLVIHMKPVLLELTNSGESHKCRPLINESSYRCEVNKILQKNGNDVFNLHFVLPRIASNNLQIDYKLESKSEIEKGSTIKNRMNFEIKRIANLMLVSEAIKGFSYSDKTSAPFEVTYRLMKSGPTHIDMAFLVIQLPTDIIVLDGDSQQSCKIESSGKLYNFPVNNNILDLSCDQRAKYCSKYLCQLPKFNSGATSQPYSLSLALIPSRVENLVFKTINFKLNSELKIDDKVNDFVINFETEIKSNAITTVMMERDVPILDAKVEPWVLFVSSGVGVFILIIALIILIKVGFFKRKKLEEIEKVKLRMSMRPDMYDINVLDMTEEELNELEN